MNLLNKRIAQSTLDRWELSVTGHKIRMAKKNVSNCETETFFSLISSQIDKFESLEDFLTYIIVTHNAPIACVSVGYQNKTDFILKLLDKKPSLINELCNNHYHIYREILPKLNHAKFIKRCKFALNKVIKEDFKYYIGDQNEDIEKVYLKKN